MKLDADLFIFAVALFGTLMSIGSLFNAALELYECGKADPPVNGATHLSAYALAVKSVLGAFGMLGLAYIAYMLERSEANRFSVVFAAVVIAYTVKHTYDYLFHMRLYAMVRPKANAPRRRTTD